MSIGRLEAIGVQRYRAWPKFSAERRHHLWSQVEGLGRRIAFRLGVLAPAYPAGSAQDEHLRRAPQSHGSICGSGPSQRWMCPCVQTRGLWGSSKPCPSVQVLPPRIKPPSGLLRHKRDGSRTCVGRAHLLSMRIVCSRPCSVSGNMRPPMICWITSMLWRYFQTP